MVKVRKRKAKIHVILENNFYSGQPYGMFYTAGPNITIPMPPSLRDKLPKSAQVFDEPIVAEEFDSDEFEEVDDDMSRFDHSRAEGDEIARLEAEAEEQRKKNQAAFQAKLVAEAEEAALDEQEDEIARLPEAEAEAEDLPNPLSSGSDEDEPEADEAEEDDK